MNKHVSTYAPTKAWELRAGGHPLGGGGGGGAPHALPLPASQPQASCPAPSSRPTTSYLLPRFAQPQQSIQQGAQQRRHHHHQVLQQSQQHPAAGGAVAAPAAVGPMRGSSQPPPLHALQPAGNVYWSQRSQMDNLFMSQMTAGPDEEQQMDNMQMTSQEVAGPMAAVVGSAPQHQPHHYQQQQQQQCPAAPAAAPAANMPYSPEINLRAWPSQAAAKVLQEITKKGAAAAAPAVENNAPMLEALSTKLDVVEGRQGKLAAAVDGLQTGVATQGEALQGIGHSCIKLFQMVQSITNASGSIEERLQQLLTKQQPPPRITGDMATQTSPHLALPQPAPGLLMTAPAQTAAAHVPSSILQAFNQRRPSSASAQPLMLPKPAALPPAPAPRRGLSSAAAPAPAVCAAAGTALPAYVPAMPTKPTTRPTTSSRAAKAAPAAVLEPSRRSRRLATQEQEQMEFTQPGPASAAVVAAAAVPGSAGSGKGSRGRRRKPAKRASAAANAAVEAPGQITTASAAAPAREAPTKAATPPSAAAAAAICPSAPSLASFGGKRQRSAEPEPAATAPSKQASQQPPQQQQPASKRQRRGQVSKQQQAAVAASQPPSRPQSQQRPPSQAQLPLRAPPASQAEALFDSLFGGDDDVAEPCSLALNKPATSTDSDFAAAVQRQMAKHQQRVAHARQRGGGSIMLTQPDEY